MQFAIRQAIAVQRTELTREQPGMADMVIIATMHNMIIVLKCFLFMIYRFLNILYGILLLLSQCVPPR